MSGSGSARLASRPAAPRRARSSTTAVVRRRRRDRCRRFPRARHGTRGAVSSFHPTRVTSGSRLFTPMRTRFTSWPSTMVCAGALDETFGKSITRRRGRSLDSVRSAGVNRPLPLSVTVVAAGVRTARTRSSIVAAGASASIWANAVLAGAAGGAGRPSTAAAAAGRGRGASSSRITLRALCDVFNRPRELQAHPGDGLAVDGRTLLQHHRSDWIAAADGICRVGDRHVQQLDHHGQCIGASRRKRPARWTR